MVQWPLAVAEIIKHWDAVKSAASSVLNFFKEVAGYIGGAFSSAWHVAASAVSSVKNAIQDVIDTAQKVASLPGKGLNLVKSILPGMAEGGTMGSAGHVLVGERGPEIVHLPAGAQVIPNHAIAGAMNGPSVGRGRALGGTRYGAADNPPHFGGGTNGKGRIVVPVYLDTRQIAVAFGEYTADQQAAR